MKLLKSLFYFLIITMVFIVYLLTRNDKIVYVSIGDSISYGENPYGEKIYGYSDYISESLKSQNRLKRYYNLANSRYSIQVLTDAIENNFHFNEKDNFKRVLRESDLVTLSIGMIDVSTAILNGKYNKEESKEIIVNSFSNLISTLKKYAVNDILVIGLYNPFPNIKDTKEIDMFIKELNEEYKYICDKNGIGFVDIYSVFKSGMFLDNPNSFNPNVIGYKAIFNEVSKSIEDLVN